MSALCKQGDGHISQQSPNLYAAHVPEIHLPHYVHCLMLMQLDANAAGDNRTG